MVNCLMPVSPTIKSTTSASQFVSMEKDLSDDDTIPYPASDTESTAEGSTTENVEVSELVNPDTYNLVDIARGILEDHSDDSLTEEEHKLIANSTVITRQYESNKRGVKKHFFDTLDSYGDALLKPLCQYAQDGFKKKRLFYIKLRGEKSEEKQFILNKYLVKIALKWQNS